MQEFTEDILRGEVLRRLHEGGDNINSLVIGIANDHRDAHIKYLNRHHTFPAPPKPFADVYEASDYMCGILEGGESVGDGEPRKCSGEFCKPGLHFTIECGARDLCLPWRSKLADIESIMFMAKMRELFDYVISTLDEQSPVHNEQNK